MPKTFVAQIDIDMAGYAVIPDQTNTPAALFDSLEDALDWGLNRFGSNAFRVRYVNAVDLGDVTRSPAPRAS